MLNRLIPGNPPLTLISCIDPGRSVAANCFAQRQDSFSAISYTVGADYRIADDIMVYAKQSRGYRSGGQQLRTFTTADSAPFQPEIVNEQEIGLKYEFFDRRVRLNLAGYHNKINDAQRSHRARAAGRDARRGPAFDRRWLAGPPFLLVQWSQPQARPTPRLTRVPRCSRPISIGSGPGRPARARRHA